MIFFKFIYALLKLFYDSIGTIWGKGKPSDFKNEFDAKCITYLKSIQHLNNNGLIKATYPIVVGLVMFSFCEVALASKIFGEGHFIVQQMVAVTMPVAFIVFMGFLTDEKIELLKTDCKKTLDKWIGFCFKWTPRIGALIITLSFIPEIMAGKQPNPEQAAAMITNSFNSAFIFAFVVILLAPTVPYLFFAFPVVIVRVGILNFIRWIINKTLEDDNTKPFVIISWVVATFVLLDAFLVIRALM